MGSRFFVGNVKALFGLPGQREGGHDAAKPQPKESASSALKCLKLKDSGRYINSSSLFLTKFKEFAGN